MVHRVFHLRDGNHICSRQFKDEPAIADVGGFKV
jgi:hypothetical protein